MKRIKNRLAYFIVNFRFLLRSILISQKSIKSSEIIQKFRKNGIIKLQIPGISDYLLSLIYKPDYIDKRKQDLDIRTINKNQHGIKALSVDICSDFLWKYIFTKEIHEILTGYFNGEYYLRNNPAIVFNYDGETHGAQAYHLDWGLRQISIMINLTDLIDTSTQMSYLLWSNNSYWFKHPNRESDNFKEMVSKYKIKNPDCEYITQSLKDSLYIFDAGNGYHRQVPGGKRIMLHFNFVDNLAFTDWDSKWKPSSKSSNEVWFSDSSKKIEDHISESGLPSKIFSLVLQNHKPGIFIPDIFTANYENFRSISPSLSNR